ncbi:hypothetical protein AAY473_000250 [Plecturocebus cupreus]
MGEEKEVYLSTWYFLMLFLHAKRQMLNIKHQDTAYIATPPTFTNHLEDCIDLCAGLPKHKGHDNAQDAQCVVSQHQGTLRLEVDAPAQVEDEVAQGETQNMNLERTEGLLEGHRRSKVQGSSAGFCRSRARLTRRSLGAGVAGGERGPRGLAGTAIASPLGGACDARPRLDREPEPNTVIPASRRRRSLAQEGLGRPRQEEGPSPSEDSPGPLLPPSPPMGRAGPVPTPAGQFAPRCYLAEPTGKPRAPGRPQLGAQIAATGSGGTRAGGQGCDGGGGGAGGLGAPAGWEVGAQSRSPATGVRKARGRVLLLWRGGQEGSSGDSLALSPGLEYSGTILAHYNLQWLDCSGMIMAHYSLDFLGSIDPPISGSPVAGTIGMHHEARLIYDY